MEKITLRALRINFGLTTKEIADKFNIGEQGVARYGFTRMRGGDPVKIASVAKSS